MLLRAPSLSEADFLDLDIRLNNGAELTPEERAAYEKFAFERDVGVALDEELVAKNLDGRLLDQIRAFAEIVKCFAVEGSFDIFATLAEPTLMPKGRLQTMKPGWLIGVLSRIAGLTYSNGFKGGHRISVTGLSKFVRACLENKTVIEEILSEAIRSDLKTNPVRTLNKILSRIGLKLYGIDVEKKGGQKVRFYALAKGEVESMTRLALSYVATQREKDIAEEMRREAGRAGSAKNNTPEQGTEEITPYIRTTTSLLSLLEEED